MTKFEIDDYFNNNHKYIYDCATNCLKKIRRVDLQQELVTETYLYLIEKAETLNKEKIAAIITNYMNKSCVWANTRFKIKHLYTDDRLMSIDDMIFDDNTNPDFNEGIFNLNIESEDDEDILHYEKIHQDKINTIFTNLAQMSTDKKILFDLYFNKGINTSGKLERYLNNSIPRNTCWQMLKKLKEDLRDGYTT
jgi:hypothetical protein